MKQLTRAVAWLLCCLLIVCSAVSCTPAGTKPAETTPVVPVIEGLKVGDADLRDFTIVTPATADITEQGAAEFLQSWLSASYGIELPLVTDETAPAAHEILIGATSRTPGAVLSAAYGKLGFASCTDGGNIVLYGPEMMSAGAVADFMYRLLGGKDDFDLGAALGASAAPKTYAFTEKTKNIIMVIGDGHSYNHYKTALQTGALKSFIGFSFPSLGYSVTHSMGGVTDSAAGGTALACGYKTYNGAIATGKWGELFPSLCDVAAEAGMNTALLTDCEIEDATPAVFYAHMDSRNSTDEIHAQMEGSSVDYFGGEIPLSSLDEELVATLGTRISPNGEPFFIMLENGLFDTASHGSNFNEVVEAAVEMDVILREAALYTFMHPGTLLLVTADHETGGLGDEYPLNTPVYGNPDTLDHFNSDGSHSARTAPLLLLGHDVEQFNNVILSNTEVSMYLASLIGNSTFGLNAANAKDATAPRLPSVSAEGLTADGFTYSLLSDGTATVTAVADTAVTALVIPETLDGHTVTAIGKEAFSQCTALSEVTIPATVVSVGGKAFDGTPWLAAQTDEFVIVGGGVLLRYNNPTATDVVIPEGVVSLSGAFAGHENLATVIFPSTLQSIGDYAFYMTRVSTLVFPETLTSIGEYAFSGCRFIRRLNLPSSLDAIAPYAFANCQKMKTVTFTGELHTLGDHAFYACPNLDAVLLPEGLSVLPESCFEQCTGMTSIRLSDTIKSIGTNCFLHCTLLEIIQFNPGLLEIGAHAFQDCAVALLELPATLTTIGEYAFADQHQDESGYGLIIPASVTSIGAYAFTGWEQLLTLVIRAACVLPENCFADCATPAQIELAAGLRMEKNAFGGMSAGEQICFLGTEAEWSALKAAAPTEGNALLETPSVVFGG